MSESLPFVNEGVIKECFHELLVCGIKLNFLIITLICGIDLNFLIFTLASCIRRLTVHTIFRHRNAILDTLFQGSTCASR